MSLEKGHRKKWLVILTMQRSIPEGLRIRTATYEYCADIKEEALGRALLSMDEEFPEFTLNNQIVVPFPSVPEGSVVMSKKRLREFLGVQSGLVKPIDIDPDGNMGHGSAVVARVSNQEAYDYLAGEENVDAD